MFRSKFAVFSICFSSPTETLQELKNEVETRDCSKFTLSILSLMPACLKLGTLENLTSTIANGERRPSMGFSQPGPRISCPEQVLGISCTPFTSIYACKHSHTRRQAIHSSYISVPTASSLAPNHAASGTDPSDVCEHLTNIHRHLRSATSRIRLSVPSRRPAPSIPPSSHERHSKPPPISGSQGRFRCILMWSSEQVFHWQSSLRKASDPVIS